MPIHLSIRYIENAITPLFSSQRQTSSLEYAEFSASSASIIVALFNARGI